jgi:hypothetical protein
MTPRNKETDTRVGLVQDDRGVIMVAGVFFSLTLIGLCWFIFGIGNAIAYRENLQNAADASAFAAAVYDARGMNLLAMINIIMGVILAMLVIAKFVEIVAVLGNISSCENAIDNTEKLLKSVFPVTVAAGVASIPFTIAKCTSKCHNIESWQSKLKNFDSGVHTALKLLHDAEVGIAVGWPWIAAGKSGNVQGYYKDGVNLVNGAAVTSTFSYSQIPWSLDKHVGDLLGNGGAGANNAQPDPPQTRYGLPVTSDTYAHLCLADFNDVTTLGGVIPDNPISGFISKGLDWFSQWFCDDATGSGVATGIVEGIPALVGPQAVAFCAIENDLGKIAKAIRSGFLSVENAATPLPMSMDMPGVKADNFSYSPMALYPPATMGLDYFGVWATAVGDYDDTLSSTRTQIAGQQAKSGNKIVATVPDDVYVGVSKAEFYYDPRATSETKDQETNMTLANQPLDVMWNMRWKARLRRYHYFPGADGIGDAALDLMNTGFTNVATAAVTDLLSGKNPLTNLLGPAISVNKLPSDGAPNIFH